MIDKTVVKVVSKDKVFHSTKKYHKDIKNVFKPLTLEGQLAKLDEKVQHFGICRILKKKLIGINIADFVRAAEERGIILADSDEAVLIFGREK